MISEVKKEKIKDKKKNQSSGIIMTCSQEISLLKTLYASCLSILEEAQEHGRLRNVPAWSHRRLRRLVEGVGVVPGLEHMIELDHQ